jgi:ectoine hydroxylase-related dioxygenase (phytanoyl-CoA dioxygenase family)
MITVEIDGSFNQPSVYAPPLVYPLIQTLLGSHFYLNGFGSVVSLPGSANQHIHRDHGPLFDDHQVDAIMPPFAITAILPLVAMNEMTGTTRMYPGSLRVPPQTAEKMPFMDPHAPVGSCLLMDYTLFHRGMENRSTQVRPIMYNIYSRAWFRDYYNYNLQSPLMIKESAYQNIPERYRHLFSAVFHNIAPVNKKNVGRNDPCPCQSGKRFKHCHGKLSP